MIIEFLEDCHDNYTLEEYKKGDKKSFERKRAQEIVNTGYAKISEIVEKRLDEYTIPQLMQMCDEKRIEYPKMPKKKQLLELLIENETPEDSEE